MKINASAERTITKFLYKNKVTRVRSTDHLVPGVSQSSIAAAVHLLFHSFSPQNCDPGTKGHEGPNCNHQWAHHAPR